ncbi:MAG: outer membrane lipoprotein carrier protein LolA [Steroidobacterales bacterium]
MLALSVCRKRVRRPCAILAFALTLAASGCIAEVVGADTDSGLIQLMQHLAQRQHGHVSFVERHFIGILDRSVETSGELFYDAPDYLEKRTKMPKPESLILDRGTLRIQRGNHNFVLSIRDYASIAPFIDSIRAILAGDLPALSRTYTLVFATASDRWHLVLVPRDAKLAAVVAKIQVSGVSDVIHTVEFERPGGDHSVMTIGALSDP